MAASIVLAYPFLTFLKYHLWKVPKLLLKINSIILAGINSILLVAQGNTFPTLKVCVPAILTFSHCVMQDIGKTYHQTIVALGLFPKHQKLNQYVLHSPGVASDQICDCSLPITTIDKINIPVT